MAKYYFGNHEAVVYHSNYLIAEVIMGKGEALPTFIFPLLSFIFLIFYSLRGES